MRDDMMDTPIAPALKNEECLSWEASQSRLNPAARRPRTRSGQSAQSSDEDISDGTDGQRTARNAKASASQEAVVAAAAVSLPIHHRLTLESLVGVSRAFRAIFSPILYARRIINLEYFAKPLKETPLPPHLEHVRDFRINVYEFAQTGSTYSHARNEEYAAWITKALESMRCLHSFSWRDESCEADYGPALTLHRHDFLHALERTETLKHVSFHLGGMIVHDPAPLQNCYIPLRGFRNLSSFELYDFYMDQHVFIEEVGSFLCRSPTIKKLGLGFACDRSPDGEEAVLIGDRGCRVDLLELLCDFYGATCKTGPLSLETLRLGVGFYVCESSNGADHHYLSQLLTVKSLKVLHIENGLVTFDFNEVYFYKPTDWTAFAPKECPSLRQLAVSRLGEDVIDWLAQDGNKVQELIMTDQYEFDSEILEYFLKLTSLHLSMLWTRQNVPWQLEIHGDSDSDSDSDSEWTDVESSIDDAFYTEFLASGRPTSVPLGSQFSDSNFSESRALNPDKQIISIINLLPDKGSHLERLCVVLGFEMSWSQLSRQLTNLTRIIQLRVEIAALYADRFRQMASSMWPDVAADTPKIELSRRFAQLMSSTCPTLQYIMIERDSAWAIIRPCTEQGEIETGSQPSISLRELDREELLEIELFAWTDDAEQAGLLGPMRDREEKVAWTIPFLTETNT